MTDPTTNESDKPGPATAALDSKVRQASRGTLLDKRPRVRAPSLEAKWVEHADELAEAQRLRYEVFATEMGAQLGTDVPGHDVDAFDAYCDHLIVRDLATGRVVGTYRVLQPEQARRVGRLYAESEFDLRNLDGLRPRMLELGRSCVDANYRSGAVVMALWGGLGQYVQARGLEFLPGCSSVSIADGGHFAASLYRRLSGKLVAGKHRVEPWHPLPVAQLDQTMEVDPPALMKGYLRLGARIGGTPALDVEFNVADFLTLLRTSDINSRYASRFLAPPANGGGAA